MGPNQELLRGKLRDAVLHQGPEDPPFKLKAGGESHWYLDCRPVTFGEPAVAAEAVFEALGERNVAAASTIGGPAVGSCSITVAMGVISSLPTFTVRATPKDHGANLGDLVVGSLQEGDRALVVEDVWTTGGSVMDAVKAVIAKKAVVVAVVVLLYRAPDAAGQLPTAIAMPTLEPVEGQAPEIPFVALYTPADLGVDG